MGYFYRKLYSTYRTKNLRNNCKDRKHHPDINHIYKFMYNLYNETQHQVICYCGYTKYENHNFRYNKLKLVCKDCSYSKYSGEGGNIPIIFN